MYNILLDFIVNNIFEYDVPNFFNQYNENNSEIDIENSHIIRRNNLNS